MRSSPPRAYVLAVTGLKREARLLSESGVQAVVSGGDPAALAGRIEAALAQGRPAGVISIGLAGALSPRLQVGAWVVAQAIVAGGTRWVTDPLWASRLAERLPGAVCGDIAGEDQMVSDAPAKAQLHARTGALAVDMESHVAARFADAHDLPFVALRVISDAADRALPPAAQAGMAADGSVDVWGVLRALAADPLQLPSLIRTGREAGVAFKALLRCHDLPGGPGIGCPYLGELALDVT